MYDITNILSNSTTTQVFYPVAGTNTWQTWQKPPTAKLIEIFCLGGGGGGGAGGAGTLNSGGGGGGAAAGYVRAIFPAYLLPDTLYIKPGTGGAGTGTLSQLAGSSGQGAVSFVSVGPTGSTAHYYPILVASSATAAGNGSTHGTNGQGGGGTAPTITTTAVAPFLSTAIYLATAGIAGAGGFISPASIVPVQALGSGLVTQGAGGLGSSGTTGSYAGSILSASVVLTQTITGSVTTTTFRSKPATRHGYGVLNPFCGTGGAGGANAAAGTSGSDGGNGFYGCGGGGGGVGTTTAGKGNGGRGGDGLVMITIIT